jgi:uncharacterized protein (DUF2236 family)
VASIPTRAAVARLLARPLPYSSRPMPLNDRTRDPGLFGPDSVTWRVMREPLLILGAGRALLMQAANPLVAQGAIDHSGFATDPYGRLERTIEWVTLVSFGTTGEARRVTRAVNQLHRRVAGTLPAPHTTARLRARHAYTASDPALLRWVHASFVETMLVTHDALVGGLEDWERDAFVREWDAVAALMGVPARLLWRDAAELRAYVESEVTAGPAIPGAGSRLVANTVLHPPVSNRLLRPGMDLLGFVATGLLPAPVRRGYKLTWTPAHAAGHRALRIWLRSAARGMPRRLRISPVYDLAVARAHGRWPSAVAA